MQSYLRTGEGKKELLNEIALELYECPRLYGLASQDEAVGIYAENYERFAKLVDRYRDVGRNFISLLVTTVRYMVLSGYRNRKRNVEKGVVAELADEHYVRDPVGFQNRAQDGEAIRAPSGKRVVEWLKAKYPRRVSTNEIVGIKTKLAVLCVKSALWIDPDKVRAIAGLTGRDPEKLCTAVQAALGAIAGKAERVGRIASAKNEVFVRLCGREHELKAECDARRKEALRAEIDALRKRYKRMSETLRHARVMPDNRVVAKALAIPKGTVDSCMHSMKGDLLAAE